LRKKFGFNKTGVMPIGLDIGSTAVRAVQLVNRGGQLSVASAMEVATPDVPQEVGLQLSGTIELKKQLSKGTPRQAKRVEHVSSGVEDSVRRLIELGGFVGRKVVLQCPVQQLDMRPVHLPAGPKGLPRSAILGALRLKVADHIGFPVEQAVIDYHPLHVDAQNGQLSVMAITADGEPIKHKIEMLRRLHLLCVGVDAQPFTMMKLLQSDEAMKQSDRTAEWAGGEPADPEHSNGDKELVAVLDIGYSGSTLVVMNDQSPLFSRRFSLGGRELTDILAQSLMVEQDQAERLNKVYGLAAYHARLSSKDDETHTVQGGSETQLQAATGQNAQIAKTILSALQPHLESYVEGLVRSLNSVIAQQRGSRLYKIVLCGTTSHMQKLDCYFSDKLEIRVERMRHRLLSEIAEQLPKSKAQTGRWTTALGLALYGEVFDFTGSKQSVENKIPVVDAQVPSREVTQG